MAPTKEMLKIALRHKPNYVCIVPEKRAEVTTEGGLNLYRKKQFLKKYYFKKRVFRKCQKKRSLSKSFENFS